MTRFETTVVVAIVAALVAVHGPAFGQYIVIDGATGSAVKQPANPGKGQKAPKAPKVQTPPEPTKPVEPTFKSSGGFEKNKELARESAIRAAVIELQEYLQKQDPPIVRAVTARDVRKMMLEEQEKLETTKVEDSSGKETEMYKATIALKVEPHHLREFRSQERSSEALWILAGLGGLAAVAAVFFRIDAWTKGYLTSWLVLGTVGAATLLGGLWWMAK